MVQKYLLAFVFGGIVAGGVIYFALAHRSAPSPAPAASQIESTQPQAAPVTPPGAAAQTPEAAPEPASVTPTPVRTTRRAKPEPSQPEAAEAVSSEPQSEQPAQVAQAPAQPEVPPQTAPAVQLQTRPPAPSEPKPQAQPSKIMRPEPVIENRDRTPQTVTIPAGTALAVRLREVISTDKQSEGDSFTATLDQQIVIDGFVIADRGSLVRGKIASLTRATRGQSHAAIALELTELNTTDGQKVDVRTDQLRQDAATHAKKDLAKVGAVAALGAIIGAAVGGGKGAAIGAGAGGAGGGGAVLASKGEEVRLPSETRLNFKIAEAVTLTEKLK